MKTLSSILAGLFALLLAGGFILGSTEMTDMFGPDQTTIARIDGDKLTYYEYLRLYRLLRQNSLARGQDLEDDALRQQSLNTLIELHQYRRLLSTWGYEVSDTELRDFLLKSYSDESGQFNKEYVKYYQKQLGFTDNEFRLLLEQEKFFEMVERLAIVSKEEARFAYLAENSKFQIDYLFVPNDKLAEKLEKDVSVTEEEIIAAVAEEKATLEKINKDKSETDQGSEQINKEISQDQDDKVRQQAITRLKNNKRSQLKQARLKEIQTESAKGQSLAALAAFAGFPVVTSEVFSPGEPIKSQGKDKVTAPGLGESLEFANKMSEGSIGKTLGPIETGRGVYYFVITKKEIPSLIDRDAEQEKKLAAKKENLLRQKRGMLLNNIIMSFRSNSKIERFETKFFGTE